MLVSRNLISKFLNIKDKEDEELIKILTSIGVEVNSIKNLTNTSGETLVIAEIVEISKMPGSDHLNLCKVYDGSEYYNIICGAPNARKGIKVILAKVGSVLGNIKINAREMFGHKSNGMLCSLVELGIGENLLSKKEASGIHEVQGDIKLGEDAVKALSLDDKILDIEIASNRPDLMGVLGLARYLNLKVDEKFNEIEDFNFKEEGNLKDLLGLEVNSNKVKYYLLKGVKDIKLAESPYEIKSYLLASGIRPINNVVDISNLVMHVYGSPLHFFDLNKVKDKVILDESSKEDVINTLDKEKFTLDKALITKDAEKVIALTGIMGGESSKIDDNTSSILIESAVFDPETIRETSKKTVATDASLFFDKIKSKETAKKAMDLALYLLVKYAGGTVLSNFLEYDNSSDKDIEIKLDTLNINRILGISISGDVLETYFDKLRFKYKKLDNTYIINPPYYRMDINNEADVLEEIALCFGINNIESEITPINTRGRIDFFTSKTFLIKDRLMALGFNDVLTYSLVESDNEENSILVKDAISSKRKMYRKTLIPSLIEVYNYNKKRKVKANIFEISNIYKLVNNEIKEETKLSLLLGDNLISKNWNSEGINKDFYTLKGVVINLLDYLNITDKRYKIVETKNDLLHPYIGANLLIDNKEIGFFGKINPLVINEDIYVLELDLNSLLNVKTPSPKYNELSKYPSNNFDIAFLMDKSVTSFDCINLIKRSVKNLEKVEVFDYYDKDLDNKKALAFSLSFNSKDETLSDEFIKNEIAKLITNFKNKLNAELRDK